MSFKRINTITGWIVFGIALLVYTITMEKSASFWDSGEFIAAAYKLQIVHPPGAPLYLLLGRLFCMFLPPNLVAVGVNFLSVFSTALAAFFVYLNTTILAHRMFQINDKELSKGAIIAIIGGGIVAAFAFTFQDSQWFNAVEAEVYALSTCLTAAVFWMALKWSEDRNDRWLLAICLVIGLSIGVHLLNLLVIPAIALLIYFNSKENYSLKGGLIAFFTGLAVLLFIQYGVILELPEIGSAFEVLFVNTLDLPFSSGLLFMVVLTFCIPVFILFFIENNKKIYLYLSLFIIILFACSGFFKLNSFGGALLKFIIIGSIAYGVFYFRNRKEILEKVSLGFLFIIIGYLSYIFVPIRSNANPPIDINNPDNVFSLLSYLNREQYGDRPLLYGPVYTAEVVGNETDGKVWGQVDDHYEIVDEKIKYVYNSNDKMLFPRAWQSNFLDKVETYKNWLNIGNKPPSMIDNLRFFFTYQLDFMYWRYFMWNFAGRQNGIQSTGLGDSGNWMSGIPIADAGRVILSDVKPDNVAHNASVNRFYLIPFAFGLIGLIFHFFYYRKDAFVLSALFILTGVAIVVYLNQEPNQPRERDYAYVGSFMAFAMWIGLAVPALFKMAKEFTWNSITKPAVWLVAAFAVLFFMGFGMNNPSTLLGILFVVMAIYAIVYSFAMMLKKTKDSVKAIVITLVIAIAPALMGAVGWDDHNRNQLRLASAVGANYLNSTDQDAILFTEGDNDTYPLWYAQEVEHVRPDVRIINNSLLKADWYADQVSQHNGMQPGLNFTFTPEEYASGVRDIIYHVGEDMFPSLSLNQLILFIKSDHPKTMFQTQSGSIHRLPTRTYNLKVDVEKQIENGLLTLEEAQTVDTLLTFHLPKDKDILTHDEYLIYDLIQRNFNKRPIYFTSENLPYQLGLSPYLQREGSSFRLYPKIHPDYGTEMYNDFNTQINIEETYEFITEKRRWGNVKSGVYLDETAQRQLFRMFDYTSKIVLELAKKGDESRAMNLYQLLQKHFYNSSVAKDDFYVVARNTFIIEALLIMDKDKEAIQLAKKTVQSALTQIEYVSGTKYTVQNQNRILRSMPGTIRIIQQLSTDYEVSELTNWIDEQINKYQE